MMIRKLARLNSCAAALFLAPTLLSSPAFAQAARPDGNRFVHPGMLSTDADFDRIRLHLKQHDSPWTDAWEKLRNNPHDSVSWKQRPEAIVIRGARPGMHDENYSHLFNDIAAAYALALDWKISGDTAKADRAVQILNAWSGVLVQIDGTSDRYLASGIYGYEIANAGELLRAYSGWSRKDFKSFQDMMLRVFYPMNRDFLSGHNNALIDHYWANWDLANIASMMSIGILLDRRDIYRDAVGYFLHGAGNGALPHLVWKIYDNESGQWQESGRDQGHSLLGVGLAGAICQMAWSQGDDLFGADDNRFLKGAEYVAKYNLGEDVPYTPYKNSDVTQKVISPAGRGGLRPTWELLYNHYVVLRHMSAPYIEKYAARVRPEGGGGDYGPNSGGFDQLGYGTLLYTIRPSPAQPLETK